MAQCTDVFSELPLVMLLTDIALQNNSSRLYISAL